MKIRFRKGNKDYPLWFRLKPKVDRFWLGQLWHIGWPEYFIELDFREINSIQDFKDSLANPYSWKIVKQITKLLNKQK